MSPLAALRACAEPHCSVLVRAGRCPQHTKSERDRPNVDVRRWYRTPQWRALRAEVLYEQPWCPECQAEGQMVPTTDTHHLRRHYGDPILFWDKGLLQALCHRHHSQHTGRGE